MIKVARPVESTSPKQSENTTPLDENVFVEVADFVSFEQQPTTSQESDDPFKDLLSNYTDDLELLNSTDDFSSFPSQLNGNSKVESSKFTAKFPAFKWECGLPENIVNCQSRNSMISTKNGSISQKSPTYSLNRTSSESSPLSVHRIEVQSFSHNSETDSSIVPNNSEVDCTLESQQLVEVIAIFNELSQDNQVDFQKKDNHLQINYAAIDDTIVRLKIRDLMDFNNPNPRFRRIGSHPLHLLSRIREKATIELGQLLESSIETEHRNGNWQRHDHKLSKRLSSSIRRARRLSSYGYKKEIFGRSLSSIRANSDQDSPFPLFIHHILTILLHEAKSNSSEGMLRMASSKIKLDANYKLCNMLGINDSLPEELCSAHNIYILADLLKRFLREIPEMLLPQNVWQLMIRCLKLEGRERLLGLQCCILMLNVSQREAFLIIAAFILELSHFKHNTLMDIKNLVTVILPNICQMSTIDPLEQNNKGKGLSMALIFVIEHIYDIMCIPTQLMPKTNKNFQIALNNFAFNVDHHQESGNYWKNERIELDNIKVKSKIDYTNFDKEPKEFFAEISIQGGSSDVFASLVDSHRNWDPIFENYKVDDLCDDGYELVEYRSPYCKNLYLKRYSGRIYDPEGQSQIYVLIEKPTEVDKSGIQQLIFIIHPIDVYNSKIIFLSQIDNRSTAIYGPEEAALVLKEFKKHYQSDENDGLNGK